MFDRHFKRTQMPVVIGILIVGLTLMWAFRGDGSPEGLDAHSAVTPPPAAKVWPETAVPNADAWAQPFLITLQRDACFGTCPIYVVKIHGDGHVEYEGEEFVQRMGKAERWVPASEVETLLAEFRRIGFFDLADRYTCDTTCLATATTSLRIAGKTKTISDYGGFYGQGEEATVLTLEGNGGLRALRALERRIDKLAGTSEWIGDGGR